MIALLNNAEGAFQLVQLPPAWIPPGGQASFQVRFQSNSPGLQSAQVRILSNDPLQSPYTFLVQAQALALPRIQVRGEPGEVILSSSYLPSAAQGTLFPTVIQGQLPAVQVFRIENTGQAPLLLSAEDRVALQGPGVQDFVVVAQPAGGVAPGGTTPFEIALLTQSEGYKEAEVIIFNSDSQHNPYRFRIAGRVEGLPLALPNGTLGQKGQIRPNPTTGRVQIDGASLGVGQFKLLDSYGRLCAEGTLESTSLWLDLSDYPAGVYLFHWQNESQQGVERVIKY
ncbi:MAG: choice-of-anchor D domain-containing protein [Microscillaceae bacterium]|nr:choice-of-anchor D domain-containing protein [Microscillaceae bacterium]